MTDMELGQTDPDYTAFIRKIKDSTGIDLAQYKEAQMKRRFNYASQQKRVSQFCFFL